MAQSGKFALAAGALLVIAALPAHSASPEISFPAGWTVSQAPLPQGAPPGERPDAMQTAFKMGPNNAPLAAISVMTMKLHPGESPQLSQQAQSMMDTVRSGYTSKGLKVSCEPLAKTTLSSLPAMQSSCQAGKEDGTPFVKQIVMLTVGAHDVYGVTFAAAPQNFSTYLPDFQKMQAGLKLQ